MGCKASKAAVTVESNSQSDVHEPDKEVLQTQQKEQQQIMNDKNDVENPSGGTSMTSFSFDDSVAPGQPQQEGEGPPGEPQQQETQTRPDKLYRYIVKAQKKRNHPDAPEYVQQWTDKVVKICSEMPEQAAYSHPDDGSTPVHEAVRLLDPQPDEGGDSNVGTSSSEFGSAVVRVVEELLRANPGASKVADSRGNIPLHYAIAPASAQAAVGDAQNVWTIRGAVVEALYGADADVCRDYMRRNDVVYENAEGNGAAPSGCSPLYRALQCLPDDFGNQSETVRYMSLVRSLSSSVMVGVGNAGDSDKPLALLYRRFTRQFDLAEKFFAGDNSRPEVVAHRRKYKTAAGNTWRIIELLLRPDAADPPIAAEGGAAPTTTWRIVHRAVQVETPPDLLRYIVETNAEDLTVPDDDGNLPLHYAAKSRPPPPPESDRSASSSSFPAFYTKYVVDELLYKFPEAASMADGAGNFPLTLAVQSGKQWIGGGIKSLYDAYPDALQQINLAANVSLKEALSMDLGVTGQFKEETAAANGANDDGGEPKEEKSDDGAAASSSAEAALAMTGIVRDEQHDAIMLVQQRDVDVSEVVTSMWAHEEDAGVQMLGCVAISRMVSNIMERHRDPQRRQDGLPKSPKGEEDDAILRIALSAVAAVVNAMKAHPNEVIVQEKACHALKSMASADGKREVSFVASGAVAAIVGAMQAHVSDPGVQEEACGSITRIINCGGADRATIVASVSGLTAIVNALAAHPEAVGVQRNGCAALRELTDYPNANLPELPRSQTESLLEAARTNYPGECGPDVDLVMSRLT